MAKKFVRKIKIRKSDQKCFFCEEKLEPDYKEQVVIGKYISERGKIVPRLRTGICQKHQRRLASAIKRARHLSLLPFIPRI